MARWRIVCTLVLTSCAFSQPAPLAFEVASIKANHSSEPESGDFKHGHLAIRNATLRHLIGAAYDLRIDLVVDGPSWLDTDRFDIEAKADAATTEATSRVMLQTLLAERFKLAVHHESRLKPAFVLTVAKNGPKLVESPPESHERPGCFGSSPLICHQRTIAQLADVLRRIGTGIELPVVDETSQTGRYDFTLEFSPSSARPDATSPTGPVDSRPSIFEALQQQLGLKLSSAKRPIEFLVVDRAERTPVEN